MAHLQYMPGDPRLVDQLVYELKSKGIFDQFRKECIADVDTRPAYQNLRQRVESSVAVFLSRQTWKSDLNKNQLREKLRKHILDGNYLEQGVERIVDQVVNPKVASVFIPQVEDLVYNYLGIPRKRTPKAETAEKSAEDLLPTDLEAVSPGSVKSNDGESKETENKVQDMEIDSEKMETTEDMDTQKDLVVEVSSDSTSLDKSSIPLPTEEIKLESIPAPENSPQPAKVELENIELPSEPDKTAKVELKNIELPREPNLSTDIPLPDEVCMSKDNYFKPIALHSEESNSSSGSSIRRNMSPITPVRNFDDENSCDAQQAFENNSNETDDKDPSTLRFNIEAKESNDSSDVTEDKKETELSYQFNNQVNINTFNTPMYDDSSNSHNLQIDYESDANTNTSKTTEVKQEVENSEDSKKERKDDKKGHKSSHKSRDSSRHSSNKDKHSNSRDSSRHDKKPSSKDDKSKSSKDRERSKDRSDRKDSSRHKSSHKSSSSSKEKHRSSSSTHRHSSKSSDERKSSSHKSSEKDKEKSADKSSRDRKESKSSSHRDKDKKSSKKDEKDKKKEKKDTDDHYSSSGRGNHSRRSTDRDSNDGSSSSKGSQNQNNSKSTSESKKESKSGSSKSDNTSTSGESTSQSDKEVIINKASQFKPAVRVDNHLETPIANPPRLPFVPDVTLKKPKFANNFEEAKKMMKMRKFLADEQKRMNQEAALLLEFQANVRPSLSQVYSSIPGPELEFACITHTEQIKQEEVKESNESMKIECEEIPKTIYTLDKPLEMKQFTKDTKEIINDIIGVPVGDYEQKVEYISGTKTTIIVEEVNGSCVQNKPYPQLADETSKHGKVGRPQDSLEESLAEIVHDNSTDFEITVTSETLSETDVSEILEMKDEAPEYNEKELQYFAEHEKFNAELERHKFGHFLSEFIESTNASNKMYIINCDTYEENIVKEIASNFGDYEIVNYYKNGHIVPNKNIVKDLPLCTEISLPLDSTDYEEKSPLFSPVKSECSFELSSDYDAKLDEIVNKKSRQEVMEIILGGIIDEPSKMPTIDYYTELSDPENTRTIVETETIFGKETTINTEKSLDTETTLKRKMDDEVNRSVLTPNKIRKISDSEQISSTTEEPEMSNNNKIHNTTRSKYLGRAKRVGLSRPKRCNLPNSPSSDKSVENYTQNTPSPTPNGKLKGTPRSKVQRYDKSDLYKPKLHYLSRRNNVS